MPHIVNPFFFESPSDNWEFTDREKELPTLVCLMKEKGRRLLVYGRRRMGKTSLIRHAGRSAGVPFVFCDVSTAASLNELAKKLMEGAPKEETAGLPRALEIAGKHLKSVGITASKVTITGELRAHEAEKNIEQVLNYLHERAADRDEVWTICLDEFQEIRALGGERVDWKLRGIIQEHRNLNYIFTGSDHRLIGWMADPAAPFFKQLHQMEVGPIDPAHMANWIEARARTGGLVGFPYGSSIVALAGPCTGDIVRLAKEVFQLAGNQAPGDLVASAFHNISLIELNTGFLSQWRPLSTSHRSVLRALAAGKAPAATSTLREYGLTAASTATSAVEALVQQQFLVRTKTGVIFDNAFFRRWVAFNGE